MRYKWFSVAKTNAFSSNPDVYRIDISLEKHISQDMFYYYDDLVSDNSPDKGKILIFSLDNKYKKRVGYIREDSNWFNYDVIADTITGTYDLISLRAPAGEGTGSMYGAIKKAFCKAIMNIEVEI